MNLCPHLHIVHNNASSLHQLGFEDIRTQGNFRSQAHVVDLGHQENAVTIIVQPSDRPLIRCLERSSLERSVVHGLTIINAPPYMSVQSL